MGPSAWGNATSDFTDGSQGSFFSAASSAGPLSDRLFPAFSQRAADTISVG